jgi:hypothetical protein
VGINKLAGNVSLLFYTLKQLMGMDLQITLPLLSEPPSNVIATAAPVTLSVPEAKGDICLLTTSDQMTNGRERCQRLAMSEALPIWWFQL